MRKYKLWSKELELTFWISKEECERGYLRSNVFDIRQLYMVYRSKVFYMKQTKAVFFSIKKG